MKVVIRMELETQIFDRDEVELPFVPHRGMFLALKVNEQGNCISTVVGDVVWYESNSSIFVRVKPTSHISDEDILDFNRSTLWKPF